MSALVCTHALAALVAECSAKCAPGDVAVVALGATPQGISAPARELGRWLTREGARRLARRVQHAPPSGCRWAVILDGVDIHLALARLDGGPVLTALGGRA